MSLHFYLNLPLDTPKEQIEQVYRKQLVKNHPDRSKKDTLKVFLEIRREYEKYKKNLTDDNFFISVFPSEINKIVCRCGSKFTIENVENGKIECECCSCYILLEKEPCKLE